MADRRRGVQSRPHRAAGHAARALHAAAQRRSWRVSSAGRTWLKVNSARRLSGAARAFAIRAETMALDAAGNTPRDGTVGCAATVIDVQYHGASSRWQLRTEDGSTLAVVRPESLPVRPTSRLAARCTYPGPPTRWWHWKMRNRALGWLDVMRCGHDQRHSRNRHGRILRARSVDILLSAQHFYLLLLLLPPLLWLGTVYLGSLFALLLQSFYAIDEFTATVVPKVTLATYQQLFSHPANVDIILRTLGMAVAVTIASAAIAFPLANYMARYAGPRMKAFLYVGVMLPMWTSYLVKVVRVAADSRQAGNPQLDPDDHRSRSASSRLRSQPR